MSPVTAATPTPGGEAIDGPVDVLVIGAGWAGLSAAVRARQQGLRVAVLEAAPQAGGRARTLRLSLAGRLCEVDNGQHLLVGAYRECLALIDELSDALSAPPVDGPAGPARAPPGEGPGPLLRPYTRHAMRLESPDGLLIRPWRAPPPLDLGGGLLSARGLSWRERWALVRAIGGLRLRRWRLPAGLTVARWLRSAGQSGTLIARFWDPLCVATLNTPLEQADAQTFAAVLRDTLGADARACEFILPIRSLDQLVPGPALAWLARHQVSVHLRTPARRLTRTAEGLWQVGALRAPHVVLALPAHNAHRLLEDSGLQTAARALAGFEYEPIVTVYVVWPEGAVSLPPWQMLTEEAALHAHGQWLFDRGVQDGLHVGAVVISARGRQWLAGGAADTGLLAAVTAQLSRQLRLPPPVDARAIVDKRATFRSTLTRPRLEVDTLGSLESGLWLAGDHVWPDYPATLEAAVRSGRQVAARIAAISVPRRSPGPARPAPPPGP